VRWGRALAFSAALAAAAALVSPSDARAHAVLARSEPADGARLTSTPHSIRLWFTEGISRRLSSIRLVGPTGHEVRGTRLEAASRGSIAVHVPSLRKGTYAVVWHVLADGDGHTTSGTIIFRVGKGGVLPPSGAGAEPRTSALEAFLRWLRFGLFALLIGPLAVAFAVLPAAGTRLETLQRARHRVLTLAVVAGALAVGLGVVALERQVASVGSGLGRGSSVLDDLLFSSRWGHLWLCQQVSLVALTCTALFLRRRWNPVLVGAAAIGAAAVVSLEALGSHAAAAARPWLAVTVDALHVGAAAIWLGGVAAIAASVWPEHAGWREAVSLVSACRRRLAFVAGGSVAVLAITGLYSAGRQIASVDALLTTLYGRTLLVKTGIVVAVGALGAVNALLLRRLARGGRVKIRPTLLAEAAVGALVFLAAGVLTASTPARGPQFAAPRPVQAPALTGQADDLLLSVAIRPNRPGENVFNVLAASSRRPPPAPITGLELGLPSGPLVLHEAEPGHYFGTAQLSHSGAARLTLVVHRGGGLLTTPFSWSVEPSDPARPVVVSSRRLSSLTDPAAVLLLIGLALAALALLLYRSPVALPRLPTVREESS
jgi:copper transport protein